MKPIDGYFLIKPEDLSWRQSNIMKIPNADFLSEQRAIFWERDCGGWHQRAPTRSTGIPEWKNFISWSKRLGAAATETRRSPCPEHGGVLVGPAQVRQVFNDTQDEVLWLIIGAPEKELERGETLDPELVYPVNPKQLPKELDGVVWPPGNRMIS